MSISRRILSCISSRGRCWSGLACRWQRCWGRRGVERHGITFHGQEAHSGSTPMGDRRDALAAAARLALEIRTIARKHTDAVCTMGSVKTFPGIVTAVVGRCECTLDQRDLDADVLAAMYREAAGGEPPFCRGRALHGRVDAHLEHRADSLPSRADCVVPGGDRRDGSGVRTRSTCRRGRYTMRPRWRGRAFRRR